jgi:hypothetical protein
MGSISKRVGILFMFVCTGVPVSARTRQSNLFEAHDAPNSRRQALCWGRLHARPLDLSCVISEASAPSENWKGVFFAAFHAVVDDLARGLVTSDLTHRAGQRKLATL